MSAGRFESAMTEHFVFRFINVGNLRTLVMVSVVYYSIKSSHVKHAVL